MHRSVQNMATLNYNRKVTIPRRRDAGIVRFSAFCQAVLVLRRKRSCECEVNFLSQKQE